MGTKRLRNQKGGFFFRDKVSTSEECNDTKLNELLIPLKLPRKVTPDMSETEREEVLAERQAFIDESRQKQKELQIQYNTCCPKGFMGRKNTSKYCKTLYSKGQSMANVHHDIGEDVLVNTPPKKPWYKFWGGKKSKKYKRRHNKRSHKRTHKRHNKH